MYNMPTRLVFAPLTKITKSMTPEKEESASKGNTNKNAPKVEIEVERPEVNTAYNIKSQESINITQKNFQEAIIWSELLGKPMCKRRKRRYYGD